MRGLGTMAATANDQVMNVINKLSIPALLDSGLVFIF